MGAAWLAAWTVAVVMVCGGDPAVDGGLASDVRAAASGSLAAPCPGGHHGSTPLAIPPIVETEISSDDVDPNEASSHSSYVAGLAIKSAGRADEAGPCRILDASVLVANAADLSRLCRLLI